MLSPPSRDVRLISKVWKPIGPTGRTRESWAQFSVFVTVCHSGDQVDGEKLTNDKNFRWEWVHVCDSAIAIAIENWQKTFLSWKENYECNVSVK